MSMYTKGWQEGYIRCQNTVIDRFENKESIEWENAYTLDSLKMRKIFE